MTNSYFSSGKKSYTNDTDFLNDSKKGNNTIIITFKVRTTDVCCTNSLIILVT
jgi:hypothetical protein